MVATRPLAQLGGGGDQPVSRQPASRSRSSSGAVTTSAWSWLAAWVRALTAERRATRRARIISTCPSPALARSGRAGLDRPGGRLGIERVGLAGSRRVCRLAGRPPAPPAPGRAGTEPDPAPSSRFLTADPLAAPNWLAESSAPAPRLGRRHTGRSLSAD